MFGIPTLIAGALKLAEWGTNYLQKKQDADVEKYKAAVGGARDLAGDALKVEAARYQTWSNVTIAAMAHPVWWLAWAMFVVPVGLYDGMIYFVSTFDAWLNTAGCYIPTHATAIQAGRHVCEWFVTAVPPDQASSRANIIYFIFGAQAASGAAAGIAQALSNWIRQK